jgi:hypothetical protein
MIKILNISDTEDGGAIVTMEMDRTLIHSIVNDWFVNTLKEAVNDLEATSGETETRLLVEEDGSSPNANTEDEEMREWKEFVLDLSETESNNSVNWGNSFTYPHER